MGALQRRRRFGGAIEQHAIHSDGPRNVLELLLAYILEADFETSVDILLHPARNANPTGFGQSLQTCRHVHAVAPYVGAVDDEVTCVNAYTKLYSLLLGQAGIALAHRALNLDAQRTAAITLANPISSPSPMIRTI